MGKRIGEDWKRIREENLGKELGRRIRKKDLEGRCGGVLVGGSGETNAEEFGRK